MMPDNHTDNQLKVEAVTTETGTLSSGMHKNYNIIIYVVFVILLFVGGGVGFYSAYNQPVDNSVKADQSNLDKSDTLASPNASIDTKKITQISSGDFYTCATESDSTLYCWGYFSPNRSNYSHPSSLDTDSLKGQDIKYISSSDYHACVLTYENKAYCVGPGDYGQNGDKTNNDSNDFVQIYMSSALSNKTVKAISANNTNVCIIASDDLAYCWGNNSLGQLGDGSKNSSNVPTAVDMNGVLSGKTIKSISTGNGHSCVIASDDRAYCWGYNSTGQLGNKSINASTTPVAVYTGGALSNKSIKELSVGRQRTCVIASDNKIYCWGYNAYGVLGYGDSTTEYRFEPVQVSTSGSLSNVDWKSISVGDQHTCAVSTVGKVYCWGFNGKLGAFGNGTVDSSSVPVPVSDTGVLKDIIINSISSSSSHTCAVDVNGKAYCWGSNYYGQLGGNVESDRSMIPVMVDVLTQ